MSQKKEIIPTGNISFADLVHMDEYQELEEEDTDVDIVDKIENDLEKAQETVLGFLLTVSKIVDNVFDDISVEFRPNTKNFVFENKDIDVIITYDVISRKPFNKEQGPKISKEFNIKNNRSNISKVDIYRNQTDVLIQFNFFYTDYIIGEKCVSIFDDSMVQYKKELKNTCTHVFFEEEKKDAFFDIYRQNTLVKNIIYRVILMNEKSVRLYGEIQDVKTKGKAK